MSTLAKFVIMICLHDTLTCTCTCTYAVQTKISSIHFVVELIHILVHPCDKCSTFLHWMSECTHVCFSELGQIAWGYDSNDVMNDKVCMSSVQLDIWIFPDWSKYPLIDDRESSIVRYMSLCFQLATFTTMGVYMLSWFLSFTDLNVFQWCLWLKAMCHECNYIFRHNDNTTT